MKDPDFPEELQSFIQEAIPTLDAAELLLLLAAVPDREHSIDSIVEAMHPTVITDTAVRRYLQQFHAQGLVRVRENDAFQYAPATPELDEAVRTLTRVFNQRPVTLVRVIYAPKDEKIRSFAEAFRIKK
jgi:hypothetical protein